jgi:hypothetical protein
VVHIPGRTNPADFLTRFCDGQGPAAHTGYDDPGSEAELYTACAFTHASTATDAPRFLHDDFAAALRSALPADPVLGPIAAAAQACAPHATTAGGACGARFTFVWRDGLLYRSSTRGDRLCIPTGGALRSQILRELHATPLGGHFGRDKTLALARGSMWWPGLPTAVTDFVRTCPTCQRVKADHLPPARLLYPLPPAVPTRRSGSISLGLL